MYKDTIRGATLDSQAPGLCARQDTIISPATDACLRVAEYSAAGVPTTFDCALSGPFAARAA